MIIVIIVIILFRITRTAPKGKFNLEIEVRKPHNGAIQQIQHSDLKTSRFDSNQRSLELARTKYAREKYGSTQRVLYSNSRRIESPRTGQMDMVRGRSSNTEKNLKVKELLTKIK